MSTKFLSVVTISFNQKEFLRQTLDSVISQKSGDVEYIVVDPGSTDGSRELLKQYESDIDVLIFEPDEGPADGLNKGFSRACGQIGYFLNSDDFLLPDAIARLRKLWSSNPDNDFLICSAWMVDGDGVPLRLLLSHSVELEDLLDGNSVIVQQGFSFRMAKFRDVGGFNVQNWASWDLELLCAMLARGAKYRVCKERLGAFRLHSAGLTGNESNTLHRERLAANHARLQRLYDCPPKRPPIPRTLVKASKHPVLTINRVAELAFPWLTTIRYRRDCRNLPR